MIFMNFEAILSMCQCLLNINIIQLQIRIDVLQSCHDAVAKTERASAKTAFWRGYEGAFSLQPLTLHSLKQHQTGAILFA